MIREVKGKRDVSHRDLHRTMRRLATRWGLEFHGSPYDGTAGQIESYAHELAHAILHVPRIRRIRALRLERILLSRMRRAELKPYLDPEWQAFALGGCILAPREAISLLPGTALAELARVFGTSESLMWMHLKRLRLLPKEEGYR